MYCGQGRFSTYPGGLIALAKGSGSLIVDYEDKDRESDQNHSHLQKRNCVSKGKGENPLLTKPGKL